MSRVESPRSRDQIPSSFPFERPILQSSDRLLPTDESSLSPPVDQPLSCFEEFYTALTNFLFSCIDWIFPSLRSQGDQNPIDSILESTAPRNPEIINSTALIFSPQTPNCYNPPELKRVWESTHEILKKGQYLSSEGTLCQFGERLAQAVAETERYLGAGDPVRHESQYQTEFVVIERDCLEEAQTLQENGFSVLILNLANAHNAGGGYKGGAKAQEEDLCRRSGLAFCLDSSLGAQQQNLYPFAASGGVYSPHVPVFRAGPNHHYKFLNQVTYLSFASVAAIQGPRLIEKDGKLFLSENDANLTKEKIRTQLKMALDHNHDGLVLGAFGCGAFCNPPHHIVELYYDVIQNEFPGCFRRISFAIFDDCHTRLRHNPEGNFKPFKDFIESHGGTAVRKEEL
jgi:uncharacterized protein (TIGR02452 family)